MANEKTTDQSSIDVGEGQLSKSNRDELPFSQDINSLIVAQHARFVGFLFDERPDGFDRTEWFQLERQITGAGRELGTLLDTLSLTERARYVAKYCQETGFPNTFTTSQRILKDAKKAIIEAARKTDVTVAYAGYADSCSVGCGKALPGSDVDFLTILVREEGIDQGEFYSQWARALNPRISDIDGYCCVLTTAQMQEFTEYLRTHDNRINEEYFYKRGWTEGQIYGAQSLITNISSKGDLINNLNKPELAWLTASADALRQTTRRLASLWHRQPKHDARDRLIKMFPKLTPEEQFVVVRILQIHAEAIALDISPTSPYADILQNLLRKGVLTLGGSGDAKHFKAEWAPYPWLFRNMRFWFYPDEEKWYRSSQ